MNIEKTWLDWASAVAPHAVSEAALGTLLAPLVLLGVFRQLAEWQRRTTLVAMVRQARGGTVVIQDGGLGGPAMWIWVGEQPSTPIVTPVMVLPYTAVPAHLPSGGRCG